VVFDRITTDGAIVQHEHGGCIGWFGRPHLQVREPSAIGERELGGAGDRDRDSSSASSSASTPAAAVGTPGDWLIGLESQDRKLLAQGHQDVWDQLTRQFEAKLILTALDTTHGRRIEAAQRLGIGRNTITRKIQELGLD
jgi:two-component system nitrogen regulation response regulator GlnG